MTGKEPRASAPTLLWYILRAHWIAGILPLIALTEISRAGVAAATAAFLLGALLDRSGTLRRGWDRLATPLVLVMTLVTIADLFAGSQDPLAAITLLVLGVQSIKFLLPKTTRDGWQLCAISFLEFLACAASTTKVQFALFLFLFLGLSIGAMWALQLEEESASRNIAPDIRPGYTIRLLGLSAAAGVLMTALLFVIIPRVGLGRLLRHLDRSSGMTGFSDAITLEAVTSIKVDRRVVARVQFPRLDPAIDPMSLYLKGAVYSRFDGTRWTRPEEGLSTLARTGTSYFVAPALPGVPLSTAEIFLEPTAYTLFVYGDPVAFEGNLGTVRVDRSGCFHLQKPVTSTVRYRVRFASPESEVRRSPPPRSDELLEIPPGLENVRTLAERIEDGAGTDREKADRFLRYLRSGFRYTLSHPAENMKDFLFGRKAGFCEHFATGLALLLRSSGIPARVAAGYLGGEWNPLGNYLIVRQSDAHAWTEAWIGGRWVMLDATPPDGNSPFAARTGLIGLYLDWVRERWDRYVVNYSLRMQAEAVSEGWRAVRRSSWHLRGWFRDARLPRREFAVLAALFAGLAVLLGWILANRYRSDGRPDRNAAQKLPRSYSRLLRALTAKGFRSSSGTTMEEMVLRAVMERPPLEETASRFLRLYHRDRFGPAPVPNAEAREAARLADFLRKGLFSRSGAA